MSLLQDIHGNSGNYKIIYVVQSIRSINEIYLRFLYQKTHLNSSQNYSGCDEHHLGVTALD
jgi:hypothetical protein